MNGIGDALHRVAARLLGRHGRHDGYAFCAADGYWFRPPYTEGKCPLCGEVAPGGAAAPPLLARIDRSWFGVALLALESLAMAALVLAMYLKR